MLLYDNPISGNCYKVRLLLALLGVEYERRELSVFDRSDRAEVLGELNPGLRVPTLVLDDGRSLGESGAILLYLADQTEYIPAERFERAQMLQWMFFEQYSHEPNIAVVRFWAEAGIEPHRRRARRQACRRRGRAGGDGAPSERPAGSSSPTRTRWRTSRCTPTRTSPTRAASTWSRIRRSARGWRASPRGRATSRSTTDPRRASPSANRQGV